MHQGTAVRPALACVWMLVWGCGTCRGVVGDSNGPPPTDEAPSQHTTATDRGESSLTGPFFHARCVCVCVLSYVSVCRLSPCQHTTHSRLPSPQPQESSEKRSGGAVSACIEWLRWWYLYGGGGLHLCGMLSQRTEAHTDHTTTHIATSAHAFAKYPLTLTDPLLGSLPCDGLESDLC